MLYETNDLLSIVCNLVENKRVLELDALLVNIPKPVNIVNHVCPKSRKTVFSIAIDQRMPTPMIEWMLKNGANPCLRDPTPNEFSATPTILSKVVSNLGPLKIVAENAGSCIDERDSQGRTLLSYATAKMSPLRDVPIEYSLGLVRFLHQARVADNNGITPLMIASYYTSLKVFDFLLLKNPFSGDLVSDLGAVDKHGRSALVYVACSGNSQEERIACVKMLEEAAG